MHCPNCGTPEQARARLCTTCGTAYASEDLLALRQLEFLLKETEAWPDAALRREPYTSQLAALKARILPATPAPLAATPMAPMVAEAEPMAVATVPALPEPAPAAPRPQPVPFDQWLLSEQTIKVALYSGGALLVLAGLIFVGVNWARIPGPAKFMVTLLATGLMYLGGYLLHQRPGLRLGAVAVLAVASGFLPLNFVVLQIYIFSARGLSPNVMWLIASLPALLLYALTAYWIRAKLFTLLSLGAVVSALTALLVMAGSPLAQFSLVYALLALVVLLVGRAFQSTALAGFTRAPLLVAANVAAPLLFALNAIGYVAASGCISCRVGNPWSYLAGMLVGVLFYLTTDLVFHARPARWAAAFAFAPTFLFIITELGVAGQLTGIALMLLALVYLLLGYALERRAGQGPAGWPLYAAGYAVAAFVTLQALVAVGNDLDGLAKTLIGDVVLLAVSARIHRHSAWVYGAAWLFIAPVYIYASLYLRGAASVGLVLGLLMLNYAALGFVLGRRVLKAGGPFLTAAAFLSALVVLLTWGSPALASLVLGVVALLYLLGALWRGQRWSWLLLPALVAIDLAALTVLRMFGPSTADPAIVLSVTYAAIGLAFALGAIGLRRGALRGWAWPVALVAALNLGGAYLAGLTVGGTLALALSGVLALLAFSLSWLERDSLEKMKQPPLFAYLGVALLFAAQFYAVDISGWGWQVWPAITAALCAALVLVAGLLPGSELDRPYAQPLRLAGLWLMLVPLVGAISLASQPAIGALTFGLAGLTYLAEAARRRNWLLAYAGSGALLAVMGWLLLFFHVTNLQAYAIPLGLWLLATGWNERRRGQPAAYRWVTLLGLAILMGTAFYQSLGNVAYGVLLLVESLAAVAWGIRTRSRGYVQLGGLALIANAVAQFGPGFVELPRWIQLGAIGIILLGGGLAALLRREQILTARRALGEEWASWQP